MWGESVGPLNVHWLEGFLDYHRAEFPFRRPGGGHVPDVQAQQEGVWSPRTLTENSSRIMGTQARKALAESGKQRSPSTAARQALHHLGGRTHQLMPRPRPELHRAITIGNKPISTRSTFKRRVQRPICRAFRQPPTEERSKTRRSRPVHSGRAGGEGGIRTLGTQGAQRFSRPPRSTTPAPLRRGATILQVRTCQQDRLSVPSIRACVSRRRRVVPRWRPRRASSSRRRRHRNCRSSSSAWHPRG